MIGVGRSPRTAPDAHVRLLLASVNSKGPGAGPTEGRTAGEGARPTGNYGAWCQILSKTPH